MNKPVGGTWFSAYGSVYSLLGNGDVVRVALMDRNEPLTTPTERDATAEHIAYMQNLLFCRALTEEQLAEALEKVG